MNQTNVSGKHRRAQPEKSRISNTLSWFLWIAGAVVIALCLRFFVFELVTVNGDSMNPTLKNEQSIFMEKISRNFGNLDRRQIVIVRYPDREGAYVKRIVGLPGDTVEVRDGSLWINGERQDEPYLKDSVISYDMAPVVVPENHYFVMGDNRNNSMDSHDSFIGPIPFENVLGHALFIIWPFDEIRSLTGY